MTDEDKKEPTQGEPERDELGQRTDVPLPENSAPNLPNPSNDPNHPSQPSGSYVADNPQNFRPDLATEDEKGNKVKAQKT